jgi:uncharacterized membrane protein (Fun14 family)
MVKWNKVKRRINEEIQVALDVLGYFVWVLNFLLMLGVVKINYALLLGMFGYSS